LNHFVQLFSIRLRMCVCDNFKGNSAGGARAYWVRIDHEQVMLDGMSTG